MSSVFIKTFENLFCSKLCFSVKDGKNLSHTNYKNETKKKIKRKILKKTTQKKSNKQKRIPDYKPNIYTKHTPNTCAIIISNLKSNNIITHDTTNRLYHSLFSFICVSSKSANQNRKCFFLRKQKNKHINEIQTTDNPTMSPTLSPTVFPSKVPTGIIIVCCKKNLKTKMVYFAREMPWWMRLLLKTTKKQK